MDKIEIYSSKKKSVLLLIGSIAFVGLGLWLMLNAEEIGRFRSPIVVQAVGAACILFFGLGIFVGIKGTIKSEIGLIIDSTGLNVNPRKSRLDFIKWKDIIGFEEIKIQSTRILIIKVRDPDFWLEKETSTFRKKLMEFNISRYNSPFNVAASGLDIRASELKEMLNRYFEKYGEKHSALNTSSR